MAVRIAKRVQAEKPEEEPIGILVAAAATLLLGGFADPKVGHVLHAAQRMRERIAEREPDPREALTVEERELSAEEVAELERLEPRWQTARAWAHLSLEADGAGGYPASSYAMWIEPLELAGREGKTILVAGPRHVLEWSERRYGRLLLECLHAAEMPAEAVRFVDWLPRRPKT